MRTAWALILGAAAVAGFAPACAGTRGEPPDARQLLERARQSAGHVAYSGRQVTVMWGRRETAVTETREYHAADGRLRIETRRPFPARGRIVVDDGRDRWQYEPSRRVVYRQASAAGAADSSVDQLLQHYSATVDPAPDVVAGRPAWRLEMNPRHAGKATRRLWIDAETGLVLRYERSNEAGRLMSASHFTEIRFGEPPARLFTRPGPAGTRVVAGHSAPKPLSLAGARARFGVSLPATLPVGYTFADAMLLPGKGHPVAHLRYRDGLSAVSLYVGRWGSLPYDLRRGRAVRLRQGIGRLYSRRHIYVLSWRGPRAEYALVGDASPELLTAMANGTAPATGAAPVPLRMRASRWLLGLALLLLVLSGLSLAGRRTRRRGARARRELRTSP